MRRTNLRKVHRPMVLVPGRVPWIEHRWKRRWQPEVGHRFKNSDEDFRKLLRRLPCLNRDQTVLSFLRDPKETDWHPAKVTLPPGERENRGFPLVWSGDQTDRQPDPQNQSWQGPVRGEKLWQWDYQVLDRGISQSGHGTHFWLHIREAEHPNSAPRNQLRQWGATPLLLRRVQPPGQRHCQNANTVESVC